ncbi:hypothetical protein LCM4576_31410 [Mesorhizobium sp. LCM 4576]|nr:hypothetical protein LCM4576_31410 [Mesorhizobium sp. LCM 4576]
MAKFAGTARYAIANPSPSGWHSNESSDSSLFSIQFEPTGDEHRIRGTRHSTCSRDGYSAVSPSG